MIPEPQLIFDLIPAELRYQAIHYAFSRAKNMKCFAIISYVFP